ncbi:unnamed protein product [Kuraishia capsulata CBS 1993]|uniref:Inorganic phosphate transport PHO88 n=1 Tax=Kuraishia capsulata CBS 1993 TaxID=1382522 RepID=W6MUW7_9ASCO|nr:uncharacterized protein KUCA_T00001931001 [Kuraishia capsulata CBS 1993]CDK25960.1 unnamed protein product [Kuraishia capsulata CBS 1993]
MNPAISNLVLMLGMTQVSRKFDWENPNTIFYVRVLYVSCTLAVLLIYLAARFKIVKKNDLTTLKYLEPANALSGQTEPKYVVTTVKDYDLKQIQSSIRGVFTGVAMMGFMHIYMKYTNPLLMQSISPLKGALENNIVKIHLWGSAPVGDLKRPFKAPSMFGGSGDVKTDKQSIEKAETAGTGGIKEE